MELAVFLLVADPASIHFELASECIQCTADCLEAADGCLNVIPVWNFGQGMKGGDFLPSQVIFALHVILSDLDIAHGHANVAMAEDLHQNREAHAGSQHCRSVSMAKLVRPNGRATGL